MLFRSFLLDRATLSDMTHLPCKLMIWLQADFRWCLSGTPLQNREQELYPYFRFLGLQYLSERDKFDRLLLKPCLSAEDHFAGHERIRNTLKTFMIRRLKSTCLASGEPIVQLPAR